MRRVSIVTLRPTAAVAAHGIHDRLKSTKSTEESRRAAAKAALVHFNVMVSRGIEPDAAAYTDLILTMGRARLEWQAYKLFSRMLERGIKPLPETYAALKSATRYDRAKLIADIEKKLLDVVAEQPSELADALDAQDLANERIAAERFDGLIGRPTAARKKQLTSPSAADDFVPLALDTATPADATADEVPAQQEAVSMRSDAADVVAAMMEEDLATIKIEAAEESHRKPGDVAPSVALGAAKPRTSAAQMMMTASSKKRTAAPPAGTDIAKTVTTKSENSVAAPATNEGAAIDATAASKDAPAPKATKAEETTQEDDHVPDFHSGNIPMMSIDSPRGVWKTMEFMDKTRKAGGLLAHGEHKDRLVAAMQQLHEEELRVFLTTAREHRSGSKDELIDRVIKVAPAAKIEAMLRRRQRYFRSVESLLEMQVRDAVDENLPGFQKYAGNTTPNTNASSIESTAQGEQMGELPVPSDDAVVASHHSGEVQPLDAAEGTDIVSGNSAPQHLSAEKALEPTPREKFFASPAVMQTPWGPMRRPQRPPPAQGLEKWNPSREEPVTAEEALTIHAHAATGDIASVPSRVLRRYARQHRLKWSRSQSDELQTVVGWHIVQFPPKASNAATDDAETAELKKDQDMERGRKIEEEGFRKTLDSFQSLQAISRRCGNMMVVDSPRISRMVVQENKKRFMIKRQAERERAMAKNAQIARQVRDATRNFDGLPDQAAQPASQVLGAAASNPIIADKKMARIAGAGEARDSGSAADDSHSFSEETSKAGGVGGGSTGPESEDFVPQELPPWALGQGSVPFNIASGTFGDPTKGRYIEQQPSGRVAYFPPEIERGQHPSATADVLQNVGPDDFNATPNTTSVPDVSPTGFGAFMSGGQTAQSVAGHAARGGQASKGKKSQPQPSSPTKKPKFTLDVNFLPGEARAAVRQTAAEAELAAADRRAQEEALWAEQQGKAKYGKYRRFQSAVEKAKAKREARKAQQKEEGMPEPIGRTKFLGQVLKEGFDTLPR